MQIVVNFPLNKVTIDSSLFIALSVSINVFHMLFIESFIFLENVAGVIFCGLNMFANIFQLSAVINSGVSVRKH